MNLSLCITTYNRYEMTIESFAKVIDDPRIDDIVISDDGSDRGKWENLAYKCSQHPKVRFYHRDNNVGMSQNKRDAISKAKNEWCIIFDSDNIIESDYLDAFYKDISNDDGNVTLSTKHDRYIFCPDFAKPTFDYRKYSNRSNFPFGIYDSRAAAKLIKEPNFNMAMNSCNYIVNRDFYLKAYQFNKDHLATDTIWHNYNHLKNGGLFRFVSDMEYFHRTHSGSGFLQDAKYNMAQAEKVRLLIQSL